MKNLMMVFGLVFGMFGLYADQCAAQATEEMANNQIVEAGRTISSSADVWLDAVNLQMQCTDARNGGEYTASVFQAIDDAVARAEAQNVPFGTWHPWKVAMLARVTAADVIRDEAEALLLEGEERHYTAISYVFDAEYRRQMAPFWFTWQQVYDSASASIAQADSAIDPFGEAVYTFAEARNEYNDIKSDADAFFW